MKERANAHSTAAQKMRGRLNGLFVTSKELQYLSTWAIQIDHSNINLALAYTSILIRETRI